MTLSAKWTYEFLKVYNLIHVLMMILLLLYRGNKQNVQAPMNILSDITGYKMTVDI